MDADLERKRKEIIKEQADQIRAKLEGGLCLGLPMDLNDPDMLIVGTWLLCQSGKLGWERDKEKMTFWGECPYCHDIHDLRLACHSYAPTDRDSIR